MGAVAASTEAQSSGSWHQAAWLSLWGDSIRIVFLIRLAPPLYIEANTLSYQSCFPGTDETVLDLLRKKVFSTWGCSEVKLTPVGWSQQAAAGARVTASFKRIVGTYPALVPHPVLVSLQEVQTSGPPPTVSDRILSCDFSSVVYLKATQSPQSLLCPRSLFLFFTFSFPSCPSPQRSSSSPSDLLWGGSIHARAKTPTASPPCLHLQFVSTLTA